MIPAGTLFSRYSQLIYKPLGLSCVLTNSGSPLERAGSLALYLRSKILCQLVSIPSPSRKDLTRNVLNIVEWLTAVLWFQSSLIEDGIEKISRSNYAIYRFSSQNDRDVKFWSIEFQLLMSEHCGRMYPEFLFDILNMKSGRDKKKGKTLDFLWEYFKWQYPGRNRFHRWSLSSWPVVGQGRVRQLSLRPGWLTLHSGQSTLNLA